MATIHHPSGIPNRSEYGGLSTFHESQLLARWALLRLVFHVVSGFFHVIVLVAVAMIVWGLVKRGAAAVCFRTLARWLHGRIGIPTSLALG